MARGKLAQARAVGATVETRTNFEDALAEARGIEARGTHVLVNSLNPLRLQGQKTAAFEIVEELGAIPDVLALPYGGGGNLCAYALGFREDAGMPRLLAAQASDRAGTTASAIRIVEPAHEEEVARALEESGGEVVSVADEAILDASAPARPRGRSLLASPLRRPAGRGPRRSSQGRACRLRDHGPRPQGSGRGRMTIRVRAPATTANIGPGFDCAAAALDLWNELEVEEGDGDLDKSHLGVRAFAKLAPVEGRRFEFVSRIPRERGLGSSASVIALGLVAGALATGKEPDPEELLALGVELEGHADNLAAALTGGVCLTWENRIVRVADSLPAVPFALVPETTVSTAEARNSLPELGPPRRRSLHGRAGSAARRGARPGLGRALRRGDPGPPARALPRRERPAPRSRALRPARGGPRGDALRVGAERDRLGAGGRGRRVRGGARPPLHGRERASLHSLQPRSASDMSDPDKRKSAALTDGPERAAARAMLKGIGFTDDDLARPIIGVATTWIETMPCNWNQRELAQHVKRGIRAAGGTPMEFNTVAVSDGVSMGTEGMRASLVSREVIADSIELVARGHLFDGLVCLVGCDKTIPAAVMALARLDLPGLALYNGSIAPGRFKGRDVTIQDVFEGIGAHAVGKMTDEASRAEGAACRERARAAASSPRTRCRRRSTSSASARQA